VEVQSDSQVIVKHIRGEFETKGERMKLYLSRVQGMQTSFKKFGIVKILREQNEEADLLAWMGSAAIEDLERKINMPIQTLIQPAIAKDTAVLTVEVVPQWAEELVSYLREDVLPTDKKVAIQLKAKAA
jgi:hypothetical protein